MVDRIDHDCGLGSIGDRSETGEFRVKETSKKRRRPDLSPHIKERIASLLPEESSESPVRKYLRQFSYTDREDMPKNSSKVNPTSPGKGEGNGEEADKNKKEMDEFRKGIKEEITAAIKLANTSAAEQLKKNQDDFMTNIKDVIEQAQTKVDNTIGELSRKVDQQTSEYSTLKEDFRVLKDRVAEIEKREAVVKLKEDRRVLEDAVLKELREDVSKVVISGYSFSEADNDVVNKLVKDTLRDGVEPLEPLRVVWKRAASDDKKSIIILDAGSERGREHILRNQKPGKPFRVKRSIPKRYRDAENQLNEKARVKRTIHHNNIKTEIEVRGTRLVLLVKQKTPLGEKANDWVVEDEVDLLDVATKNVGESFKLKEKGKSVLVTMNNEVTEPSILKSLVNNKLTRFTGLEVAAVDRRNVVIDCPSTETALEVIALLRVEILDSRVAGY